MFYWHLQACVCMRLCIMSAQKRHIVDHKFNQFRVFILCLLISHFFFGMLVGLFRCVIVFGGPVSVGTTVGTLVRRSFLAVLTLAGVFLGVAVDSCCSSVPSSGCGKERNVATSWRMFLKHSLISLKLMVNRFSDASAAIRSRACNCWVIVARSPFSFSISLQLSFHLSWKKALSSCNVVILPCSVHTPEGQLCLLHFVQQHLPIR